jgi:hypothetical protein
MEIQFTRTEEDVRALVDHTYRGKGPTRKRLMTLVTVRSIESALAVLLGVVLGSALLGVEASLWVVVGVGLLLGFAWGVFYLLVQLLSISNWVNRDAKAALSGGHNRNTLGPVRVVSDADGIRWSSSFGSSTIVWAGVERVERGSSAVYVFLNSNTAMDIPRRAFADDASYEEFFAEATEFFQTAQAEYDERAAQASG